MWTRAYRTRHSFGPAAARPPRPRFSQTSLTLFSVQPRRNQVMAPPRPAAVEASKPAETPKPQTVDWSNKPTRVPSRCAMVTANSIPAKTKPKTTVTEI